jgi:AcrR family transcriptional regulator
MDPPAPRAQLGVRPPRQDRSRRTLIRILSAAREILAQEGVEGITVQAVVERAGASVGSFYARFSGKEDLLQHLGESIRGEVSTWWAEAFDSAAWETLSMEASVEALVGLVFDGHQVARDERRALRSASRSGEHDGDSSHVRAVARDILLRHRDRIRHPDPVLAIDLGLRAVMSLVRELAGKVASGPERLRPELTRLYLAYLGAPSYEEELPDEAGGVDYFDVWG